MGFCRLGIMEMRSLSSTLKSSGAHDVFDHRTTSLKLSWDKNILELDIVILQTIGIVIWSGGFTHTHTCVLITRKQKGPLVGFQLTPSDLPTHPRNPMMDRQTWLVTHTHTQRNNPILYIYVRSYICIQPNNIYIYAYTYTLYIYII